MMMKRRIGLLFACILLARGTALSSPACGMPVEVEMGDGTRHQVRPKGDEFFNWVEDAAGFAVAPGTDGKWRYARRVRGRWAPEGMTPVQHGLEGRSVDLAERSVAAEGAVAPSSRPSGAPTGERVSLAVATPAPAPLLVILITFANRSLTYSSSSWATEFFGTSGKTVNTYYKQASGNRFWFTPATESEGTANDGVIRVTVAVNHPNTKNTDAATIRAAIKAALIAANPYIDYHAYDTDGNGILSASELHLVFVFAGYDACYGNPTSYVIWAHSGSFYTPGDAPLLDGVYVGQYAATNSGGYIAVGEIHYSGTAHQATIGVICHELGHSLGLIDLYDTDFSSDGVGAHCLMGTGNWGYASGDAYLGQTPVLLSAYCRQALGFTGVRTASGQAVAYPLKQVSDSSTSTNIVRINTSDSQQYFLIENRQQTGFDAGLYYPFGNVVGGGLAIWHIDESKANNATDARRRVDLEEAASPVLDGYSGYTGKVQNYYYWGNVTRFDATTSPSSVLYGGAASLASVYTVGAAGAQMSFTADAGAPVMGAATQSLAFAWQGGTAQVVFRNEGNLPLVWQAASETWCAAWPTNGTLAVGSTQQVAVVCAPNLVRQVSRTGRLSVTGTDASGTPSPGSPVMVPLAQAARPPDPGTVFSVR